MADWFNIVDAQVDPDAPLTSELAYAWRDNVIAAMQGAVGAPRLARKMAVVSGSGGTTSLLVISALSGYSGFSANVSSRGSITDSSDITITLQASNNGTAWSTPVTLAAAGTMSRSVPFFISFDFINGRYFSSSGSSAASGVMPSYPSGANRVRISIDGPGGATSIQSSALVEYTGGHAP